MFRIFQVRCQAVHLIVVGWNIYWTFNVHGSVHRKYILICITNKMQRYTVYFIFKVLYMFRVVPPPHLQERKQLYLQHLVFVTPLLLPAAVTVWQIADAVDTVICAPEDGVVVPPEICRAVSI
jgi:hypothetical protein